MSKVEHYYKHRLKPILKQHHFNVNRAPMNKYSCIQILISFYMDRFAYMQNLRICNLKFAIGLNQVQITRICIGCKFCIPLQIHSLCTSEYICIYANICTRMQVCPCECSFIFCIKIFVLICCIKPLGQYKVLSASLLTLMPESITTGH